MLKLSIDKGRFIDPSTREVVLRGINFAADAKLPASPYSPSHVPDNDEFYQGDDVSFVGSPFEVSEADSHLKRLRAWGFNTIRYIFTWEAIEHKGPGIYDEEFIDFTIQVLQKVKEYGFYVIMDPHQDCWSRYCGGSGAPLWTLYAVGLNPRNFKTTQAALLESHFADNIEERPKMLWASNYTRLAASTLFTLFFAGKAFAPKCIIDEVNIQEYLESHFINACKLLAKRIYETDEVGFNSMILGWESINEPGHGYVGIEDLTEIPKSQQVRLYSTPTGAQGMALGSGIWQRVVRNEFTSSGCQVVDSQMLVDPKGVSAWLSVEERGKIDQHYGWTRGKDWQNHNGCIWNLHNVWKHADHHHSTNGGFIILRPDYFAYDLHGSPVSHTRFVNEWFVDHWVQYRNALRTVIPKDSFMFLQPPVLSYPPNLEARGIVEPYLVYAPHYYDGLTLMLKKWNKKFNVDALGVIRGKYATRLMALRFGEQNIRKSLGDQLLLLKQEGIKEFGSTVPCFITEIGIPFDMDDCKAYQNGDYSSQARALDANYYALEYANLGHTIWTYCAKNTNQYGDGWNGEDLSIWTTDSIVTGSKKKSQDRLGNGGIPPILEYNNSTSSLLSNESNNSSISIISGGSNRSNNTRSSKSRKKKLAQSFLPRSFKSSSSTLYSLSEPPSSKSMTQLPVLNNSSSSRNLQSGNNASLPSLVITGSADNTTIATIATNATNATRTTTASTTGDAGEAITTIYDPSQDLVGARAPQSFIRPTPFYVNGTIMSVKFIMDLQQRQRRGGIKAGKGSCCFTLKVKGSGILKQDQHQLQQQQQQPNTASNYHYYDHDNNDDDDEGGEDSEYMPTIVFIPTFQFPIQHTSISTSSGVWKLDRRSQLLYWWHAKGAQILQVSVQPNASASSSVVSLSSSASTSSFSINKVWKWLCSLG